MLSISTFMHFIYDSNSRRSDCITISSKNLHSQFQWIYRDFRLETIDGCGEADNEQGHIHQEKACLAYVYLVSDDASGESALETGHQLRTGHPCPFV